MKSLNAKRIAAVVSGAALLGVGLAFAGSVTFQNVPVITTSGQPVVQVVVGSNAKASDGVAAANIAAAIGNLAFTSVPVTASVNATQAAKVLHVSVSNPSYTLSNQQVWLNESGQVGSTAGTYSFTALIGSVLNGGVILGSSQVTKSLQGAGQYSFPETTTLGTSPTYSPYSATGYVPVQTSVTSSNNGGGLSFTAFTSAGNDNILQISSSQLPTLSSNYGAYSESSYLWFTGFPVFNQQSGVNNFQILDAGGAYQAVFGKPIQFNANASLGQVHREKQLSAQIRLLGQNWTIVGGYAASGTASSTTTAAGGQIGVAQATTPVTTVYVGHNLTIGNFTVQLQDLGQATAGGLSPAALAIYYKGKLTNTTQLFPGNTLKFNASSQSIYVKVNNTFAGYYQYAKYAKLQAYTNVYNITNGQVFNQTTNSGWFVNLLWTNTTSTTATNAVALQSIIIYNATPTNLSPGQSFSYIQNPQAYKVTFVGDTLGASNYDAITATSGTSGSTVYQNFGTVGAGPGLSITNITEPQQQLTVTSQIPNAFSYSGQTGSSVVYDLTPYELNEFSNALFTGGTNTPHLQSNSIALLYNGGSASDAGNWITSTYQVIVTVTGYVLGTGTNTLRSSSYTFSGNAPAEQALTYNYFNVTGVRLSRALPGTITVNVIGPSANSQDVSNILLAGLQNFATPTVQYTPSGQVYASMTIASGSNTLVYNQQNGQPTVQFYIATNNIPNTNVGLAQYDTYTINEIGIPTQTGSQDQVLFGIVNSTAGVGATPLFQLNYSAFGTTIGKSANMSYIGSQYVGIKGNAINAGLGFRTERGSKIASITPTVVTFNYAKNVDTLQLVAAQAGAATPTTSYKLYGPYSTGQSTNIANVSIGKVNATIALSNSGSGYTISGIQNITATPSISQATTPVLLKNISTTAPLVVLASAANPGSNLILVGSGYVNTLSAQLQQAYNITASPTMQIDQAYGTNRILVAGYTANQTTAAANAFIQQLYAATH